MLEPLYYVSKPVVIEAMQFTGDNYVEIKEFINEKHLVLPNDFKIGSNDVKSNYISIVTLEGVMRADIGDYIIKGTAGEFYPCKPSIFETKYKQPGKEFVKHIKNMKRLGMSKEQAVNILNEAERNGNTR